ncbi:MAG: glycosyltransferase [Patescibacteria group bacterium]
MRVALVHDYLAQDGGAERVLKAMHEIWPEAPIFVLFHDPQKINYINQAKIRESFLGKMPFVKSSFQWYLPFMPGATERFDMRDFDVVVSSSSAFAKGVITQPETLHISYCHTPTRYLWGDTHEYLSELRQNWLVKTLLLPQLIHRLRLWDKMSADRVDHFVANSKTVQHRILKYYRRPSEVIYPPVETDKFSLTKELGDYFVAGGRLVPYKRLDLIVQVFNRLRWPLKIFGTGPEFNNLKKYSRPNIEFLGRISETAKAELLSKAQAFLHPQIEDLGITAIEAMSAGRPVIAYAQGGATETVVPGETGVFFYCQKWESLLDTLLHFRPENWDRARIRQHAEQFSANNFKQNLKKYVEDRHEEFRKGLNQNALSL